MDRPGDGLMRSPAAGPPAGMVPPGDLALPRVDELPRRHDDLLEEDGEVL
jgi:hypothetical protein